MSEFVYLYLLLKFSNLVKYNKKETRRYFLFYFGGENMQAYLKEEMKRAFLSNVTILSIIVAFISIFIGTIETYLFPDPENNAFNLLEKGYSDILSLLFPLLVAIPFTASYIIDRETGYLKYILVRMKLTHYMLTRLLVNGLVGGFVLAFSLTVSFILFVILKGTHSSVIYSQVIILKGVLNTNPFLFAFALIFNSFICGFVFATFGLGMSTFLKNKYLTVLFPFIFYVFSGTILILINPLFHSTVIYDLSFGGSTILTVLIYDIILLLLGIITFVVGVSRNVEQDL